MTGLPSPSSPISVAVMTHNEHQEFEWLMRALEPARHLIGEVVVVDDFSDAEFCNLVRSYTQAWPIRFFQRRLRQDFAAQRNFAKAQCSGRLILFPDADELPTSRLVLGLTGLLAWMDTENVDACTLPRLNVLRAEGSVPDLATIEPAVTAASGPWEDQIRILRNLPHLRWRRRLHEYLIGPRKIYRFPRTRDYVLLHAKTSARIERQQRFYRSMAARHFSRHLNSMMKRLRPMPSPAVIVQEPPI